MIVVARESNGRGSSGLKRGVILRRARGWRGVIVSYGG